MTTKTTYNTDGPKTKFVYDRPSAESPHDQRRPAATSRLTADQAYANFIRRLDGLSPLQLSAASAVRLATMRYAISQNHQVPAVGDDNVQGRNCPGPSNRFCSSSEVMLSSPDTNLSARRLHDVLLPYFTATVNASLREGCLPECQKKAHACSIHSPLVAGPATSYFLQTAVVVWKCVRGIAAAYL